MEPKKSLGQHFLSSPAIARKIAEAAGITPEDLVLEVGPGRGILTRELLARAKSLIAIEKDRRLIDELRQEFSRDIGVGKMKLIEGDVLEQDLGELGLRAGKYIVAANIPYYITGLLLRFFLESSDQPKHMTLLVQREVAERIARDPKESLLSLSVKVYGEPYIEGIVRAGSFIPAPSVDSAILSIKNISKKNFKQVKEKDFFHILKTGFAHKRKLLSGNLSSCAPQKNIGAVFESLGIEPKTRAEDLPLQKWLSLAEKLS